MEASKYKRRGGSLQAILVTRENIEDVASWCNGRYRTDKYPSGYVSLLSNGVVTVVIGEWLVKDEEGVFQSYSQRVFNELFEEE